MKPYLRKKDDYYDLQNQFLEVLAEVKREKLVAEFAEYCHVSAITMQRFSYTSTACPGRQLCRRALRLHDEYNWKETLRAIVVPKRVKSRKTPTAHALGKHDKYYMFKMMKKFCDLGECGHRCPFAKDKQDCRFGGFKYPRKWTEYDIKKMSGLLKFDEVKNDT